MKQCGSGDADALRPFADAQGLAPKFKNAIVTAIAALFDRSCPTAIAWVIAFVVVSTVQRRAWRSFTHVRKENFKA
jgi:hypothetical protein